MSNHRQSSKDILKAPWGFCLWTFCKRYYCKEDIRYGLLVAHIVQWHVEYYILCHMCQQAKGLVT